MRIQDFDDPAFDPFYTFDHAHLSDTADDPHQMLADLRAKGPVHHLDFQEVFGAAPDPNFEGYDVYTVVGPDEIFEVLQHPEIYSNEKYFERNIGKSFGKTLTVMDPPEHGAYRRLFQKAFMPGTVAKWGDTLVTPIVNDLVDKFADNGRADLLAEFTRYYPFHIIYKQLNLPPEDIDVFQKLAVGLTCIVVDVPHGVEASQKLGAYYRILLAERRGRPLIEGDLISLLAHAEIDGESLPEEIIVSFLRQLINAAGDTTFRATSTLLVGLLTNPDQLEAVRKDRALIPAAIDEALRWDGPVTMSSRVTLRESELGGVRIPAGVVVDSYNCSYNRDPAKFENPHQYNLFRPQQRHLAFATVRTFAWASTWRGWR
jgi:cytochrome P450